MATYTVNIPTATSFHARHGMFVTKEDIRFDRITRARHPPAPTTNPNGSINYSSLRRIFTYALNEFSYRWYGDPLRSMMRPQHGDDSDTSDEEFPDLKDEEDIEDTPVKECLELLKRSLVPESEKEVLKQSFSMFVQFAFEIRVRVVELADRHYEGKSKFFGWVFESMLEAAKVLREKRVAPERNTLATILGILGFEEVFDVFKKKKRVVPKEGQVPAPETAAAKKQVEKQKPSEKAEEPVETRESHESMDKLGTGGNIGKSIRKANQ